MSQQWMSVPLVTKWRDRREPITGFQTVTLTLAT